MDQSIALELASIRERHPKLQIDLHTWMAVIRLKIDPVLTESIDVGRTVVVDHLSLNAKTSKVFDCSINWTSLKIEEAHLVRIRHTYNDNEITEKAAIAVMSLLVNELESVEISHVLQIGSGGDYVGHFRRNGLEVELEVSGIKSQSASYSRARLKDKCNQVRKGFASVTTFEQANRECNIAHSFLHYVELKN